MIVDSLPTVIVVSVKVCADKHLKAGKHFLGKPQTDLVCGVIILDLSGREGLFVMIIIHAASLAVEIFGCHKFIVGGSTYAIYPRQIAVSVLVKSLCILRNITDDRPHRALILLLRFDIITRRHRRLPRRSAQHFRLQLCRRAHHTDRLSRRNFFPKHSLLRSNLRS